MSQKIINLVTHMEAGGAQAAAIRLSEEMIKKGMSTETWFIYQKSDTYINRPFVKVIHNRAPSNIFHAIVIVYKLFVLFKKVKPHAVISHTHYASTLGHIASFLAGVNIRIATMHNPVWTYPKMALVLNKLLGNWGIYSKIIAVSDTVRRSCDQYSAKYKSFIEIIYNGANCKNASLSKQDALIKFGLPGFQGKKILVMLGRLHPQKNQDFIIQLMPELDNYILLLAGNGELYESFQQSIQLLNLENKVFLLGEIKPDLVPDFLSIGDIFLFPSVFEAFGFVLLEAGHNNLPIVASNIPSNKEVLINKQNESCGIIVPDMQKDSWVNAIKSLDDLSYKESLVSRMKIRTQEFGLSAMIDRYTELCKIKK